MCIPHLNGIKMKYEARGGSEPFLSMVTDIGMKVFLRKVLVHKSPGPADRDYLYDRPLDMPAKQ